jgi:glucans biosynthesis protein
LVELPTNYEGLDNVVAFWDPKTKPAPMEPFRMSYTLFWTRENDMKLSPNKAVATRIGTHPRDAQQRQVMIDFRGPKLDNIPENAPPKPVASCSENGAITEVQIFKNSFGGGWRVFLRLKPNAGNADPIDLRCTLVSAEENVSETWTYHWSPP